jgi:hypothetical protein
MEITDGYASDSVLTRHVTCIRYYSRYSCSVFTKSEKVNHGVSTFSCNSSEEKIPCNIVMLSYRRN